MGRIAYLKTRQYLVVSPPLPRYRHFSAAKRPSFRDLWHSWTKSPSKGPSRRQPSNLVVSRGPATRRKALGTFRGRLVVSGGGREQ